MSKVKEVKRLMVGKRFGRWEVLEVAKSIKNSHKLYLCRCDCGKTHKVFRHNLVSGLSLGCKKCSYSRRRIRFNFGDKIGQWTIIGSLKRGKNKKLYHKCICSCGYKTYVLSTILKNGYSKHCKNCPNAGKK